MFSGWGHFYNLTAAKAGLTIPCPDFLNFKN